MSRVIAFLIFEQFQILDAAGPIAAFEMPIHGRVPPPYTLKVIARDGGLVRSSSGALLYAEPMQAAEAIDTLIVVGGQGTAQAIHCAATLDFIRAQALVVRRLCSVCSGSYLLAAAGLLDGRRATTHWGRSSHFARTYPQVRLETDQIFICDGQIWTAAGVSAGIDLALALIGEDLGEPVAKRVAQELVVYHRRSGGQSQFSALLDMGQDQGRFRALLGWVREHIGEALPVERLAEQCHMSPRHFARSFAAETGMTPARAVEKIRLEVARERVEHSPQPIEAIAMSTGFGDPERMRRAFLRVFGQPPQALRRVARVQSAT